MQELADRIEALLQQPTVRVYHGAAQPVTTAVATLFQFNSERWDIAFGATSTQHDTATQNSRLVCRYAGKYLIGAQVQWSGASGGAYRNIYLRLNGATTIADISHGPATVAVPVRQALTTLALLTVGDYVEVLGYQDSGATLNIDSLAQYSPEFWWVRVA
jgi:hypothetical protein